MIAEIAHVEGMTAITVALLIGFGAFGTAIGLGGGSSRVSKTT